MHETSLIPGNKIYFNYGNEWTHLIIKSVRFPRGSEVEFSMNDGKRTKGTLRKELVLSDNWNKSPDSITLRSGKKTEFLPLSKVVSAKGLQNLHMSDIKDFDKDFIDISHYQRLETDPFQAADSAFPRWTRNVKESNGSGYDLFTPPIIFIYDGKLTTRVPEVKEEEPDEPFGLKLTSVSRRPYPHRLISWIGEVPYFEDMETQESPSSNRPVRNRIEINVPYKKNLDRKPGQPSLIPCDLSDADKVLMVERFVVQQHRNPQTGGLRPVGRSMVRDFSIPEPFEIHSLMTEVFAGTVDFEFTITLDGYQGKSFKFASNEIGKIISVGGRDFSVLAVNLEEKSIRISKKDPRQLEAIEQTFVF